MIVNNVLGIDVGERRIGLARASMIARLPEPIAALKNDDDFIDNLRLVINEHQADLLVVGLPRNMQGEETAQTVYVKTFCDRTLKQLGLPIVMQDETLTSKVAENRLGDLSFNKGTVDSEAAAVILEDYFAEQKA